MIEINRIDDAVDKFSKGYACSQAILSEYGAMFSLDVETALKLAAGFAGGMCVGNTCGAVTGAYMVLGLMFGEKNCETSAQRKSVYDAIDRFTKQFEEQHGATSCSTLLGCDMDTPEGLQKAIKENLFKTRCPIFVRTAAQVLEAMFKNR